MATHDQPIAQQMDSTPATYFKSCDPASVILHVEYPGGWENYWPNGARIASSSKPFPAQNLAQFEPITKAEFDLLLHSEPEPPHTADPGPHQPTEAQLEEEAFLRSATRFRPLVWRLAGRELLGALAYLAVLSAVFFSLYKARGVVGQGQSEPEDSAARILTLVICSLMVVFWFAGIFYRARQRADILGLYVTKDRVRGLVYPPYWKVFRAGRIPRTLLLTDLDLARSARRVRADRFFGTRYLYSNDGARLRIELWAMRQDEVDRLFAMLRLPPAADNK